LLLRFRIVIARGQDKQIYFNYSRPYAIEMLTINQKLR
jgi:hypothetical protein